MKITSHLTSVFVLTLATFFLSFGGYAAGTEESPATSGIATVTRSSALSVTPSAPAITPITAPKLVRVIPAPNNMTIAAPAAQGTMVAKVVWVKGLFKAMSNDAKTRTLAKSDVVYLHDTLTTDANTEAEIVFTDDTLMTFRPGTSFYVNNYAYNPNAPKGASAGTYVMNLLEGGFRTITGLIAKAKPTDYHVNTPVATIGVRGTDYAVYLKDGQLFMGYYKGSPCVSNKNQTLCLDQTTPYARVASPNSVPVPMAQQPPELGNKLDITTVTFTAFSGPLPPGGGSSGGSSTLGPNNITTPGSGGVNGILSSFCIQ